MEKEQPITSLIMAAGRGSRMKGYGGSKTLLPLMPEKSPYEGKQPILIHIIENLPFGPKGVVVHHRKEEICKALEQIDVSTIEQPVLNGTGRCAFGRHAFHRGAGSQPISDYHGRRSICESEELFVPAFRSRDL